MPKTAVVLATYNGEKLLEKQLDSIRNQTIPADYVLFRDDKSTDGTVDYLKQYIEQNQLENWIVNVNNHNLGWRKNFRQLLVDGIELDIDYLFLSDQDDEWSVDKNEKQINILDNHPEIELLTCDSKIKIVGEDTPDFKMLQFPDKDKKLSKFPEEKHYKLYRGGRAMAMRKSYIASLIPYWKEEYNTTHDVLLYVVASQLGVGYNLNEELITHLRHGNNASGGALLSVFNSKNIHISELYKLVGFYSVIYHVLRDRGRDITEIEEYYNFYKNRYDYARENKTIKSLSLILTNWKYYRGMSGRIRDVIFSLKRK